MIPSALLNVPFINTPVTKNLYLWTANLYMMSWNVTVYFLTRWEELCASSVTLATRCFVSCDFSFLRSQSNAIRYFFSFWYSVCNSSNNILCDSSVQDMGCFFLWKILNIFKNRTSRTVNFGVCHSSLTVINLWLILFYLYSYFPHSVLFWSKL